MSRSRPKLFGALLASTGVAACGGPAPAASPAPGGERAIAVYYVRDAVPERYEQVGSVDLRDRNPFTDDLILPPPGGSDAEILVNRLVAKARRAGADAVYVHRFTRCGALGDIGTGLSETCLSGATFKLVRGPRGGVLR